MGLNRRQLRAISIALERYHQFLDALEPLVEQWAQQPSASPDAMSDLRRTCRQARQAVAGAMASLQIQHSTADPHMWAMAQLASLWATLEDLAPAKLRRYGEVDPKASAQWQQALAELQLVTKRLMAQLQEMTRGAGEA